MRRGLTGSGGGRWWQLVVAAAGRSTRTARSEILGIREQSDLQVLGGRQVPKE